MAEAGGTLRIQWQQALQAQDRIGEHDTDQTERQHGEGVLLPALLTLRIDAEEVVGELFERPDDRIEPGAAIGIEHLNEVAAHRLGDEREKAKVEGELKPVVDLHGSKIRILQDAASPP